MQKVKDSQEKEKKKDPQVQILREESYEDTIYTNCLLNIVGIEHTCIIHQRKTVHKNQKKSKYMVYNFNTNEGSKNRQADLNTSKLGQRWYQHLKMLISLFTGR